MEVLQSYPWQCWMQDWQARTYCRRQIHSVCKAAAKHLSHSKLRRKLGWVCGVLVLLDAVLSIRQDRVDHLTASKLLFIRGGYLEAGGSDVQERVVAAIYRPLLIQRTILAVQKVSNQPLQPLRKLDISHGCGLFVREEEICTSVNIPNSSLMAECGKTHSSDPDHAKQAG